MPTGYTAPLYEGEAISFRAFVLRCSRAMGARIMERDDQLDSKLPKRVEPSDYHRKALEKAQAELRRLSVLSEVAAQAEADAEHDRAVEYQRQSMETRAARRDRYQRMLDQVLAWRPPTDEHQGLKDFMAQQLRESLDFDCSPMGKWDLAPERKTAIAWLAEQEAKARRDVEYHQKEWDEEVERTRGRNEWIEQLVASLPSGGEG